MAGKLTRKPVAQAAASVDEFIDGARQDVLISYDMISNNIISYPWDDPQIRADVLKLYNLRLPEPYLLKLKYIAEHTPDSMQKFCIDTLLPAIDAKIEALAGKT